MERPYKAEYWGNGETRYYKTLRAAKAAAKRYINSNANTFRHNWVEIYALREITPWNIRRDLIEVIE